MSLITKKIFILTSFVIVIISCKDCITIDKTIVGNTEEMILKKFHKPKKESIFKFTKNISLYEYQSNLYSLHPNLRETDTILIKEMFWKLDDGCKMVIWLENKNEKWLVVDNLVWSEKVKF